MLTYYTISQDVQEPTSDLGEILVSLLYNENLHRLTVTVIEARGLKVGQDNFLLSYKGRVTTIFIFISVLI